MDPDKYQQAWQADAAQTRVTINADLLLNEVRRSHQEFQSTIFWRDVREVGASLLMIPFWFLLGITLSLPWTWYLTVLALVWVTGFILVDRRRYPQRQSEPGEPLLYYVKESLTQLEHQIWLLRNVFWWYLLPFSISIMAFFSHTAWKSFGVWWVFLIVVGLSGLFLFVLYGWVYRLNQRAVRMQLEPRRQELLKLVASLESETTNEDSHEIVDFVSALAAPVQGCSWAENWNRIIPSWREATAITLATLGGAFCGLWFPIDEMGPVFFQSVVGAVIAFEITLGLAWLRSRKRHKSSLTVDRGPKNLASSVKLEDSANQKRPLLPGAPAMLIIALTVFVSIMAVLALYRFMSEARRGNEKRAGRAVSISQAEKVESAHYDLACSFSQRSRKETARLDTGLSGVASRP